MRAVERLAKGAAIALLALTAIVWRFDFVSRTPTYPYDSYYYLSTAESLRSGSFEARGVPHTRFLPLYPAVAAVASLGIGTERAARHVPALAWGGVVVLTYLLGRRLFSDWVGLAAAVLVAIQPIGVKWSSVPMAEAVFTLTFMGSIYAACLAALDHRQRLWFAAGALGGLSMLGRHEGAVALLIGGGLALWARRRPQAPPTATRVLVLSLALFLAFPLLWQVRAVLVATTDQSYASELSANVLTSPSVAFERVRYYGWRAWLNPVFAGALWGGAAMAILRRRWRPGGIVLAALVGMFVGGHLLWYYVYERFVVPALPAACLLAAVLIVTLAEGVATLLAREGLSARIANLGAAALAASAVALVTVADRTTAMVITDGHSAALSDDWGGPAARAAASETAAKLGSGETIATNDGALVAWYADRPTVYLPFYEFQTVDLPDVPPAVRGLALLEELQRRRVRFLIMQTPPDADPRQPLADLGLTGKGLTLDKVYRGETPAGRLQVSVIAIPRRPTDQA